MSCFKYGETRCNKQSRKDTRSLHLMHSSGTLIVDMVDGREYCDISFLYILIHNSTYSGNNTSYDEQVPPEIPDSLAEELERHQVKDNYRPQNWGGGGGDWCS